LYVILLTCAVERELAFWKTREDVELLVTGVGPVEAAANIARALARRRYRMLVNAGLAGAVDGAAKIGDGVVIARDRLELDLETGAVIALPGGERVADRADADSQLVAGLTRLGFAALQGVTVSRVTATERTARRLAEGGAQVESMEGFAALRAAELAGVPAIELRGISNRVGDRDQSGWSFAAGERGLETVVRAFFESIDVGATANYE
jgi:futalosine hydrolase